MIIHDSRDPLRRIGFNSFIAQALPAYPLTGDSPARVAEQHGLHCLIHTGEQLLLAQPLPAVSRTNPLVVGDWVLARIDAGNECWISARLAPYTSIHRIDPSGSRQALASNIDCAFLVMGLDHDFNPRRLERYLALARSSGVWPVVVLTKADICADVNARLDELSRRLPDGIDRHAVNATDPDSLTGLAPYLGLGQTCVLLGSSGAGKSTLTNSLAGTQSQKTAATRESDGRGRHTTTRRQLVQLASGACLIDTPGLRGLRLDIDAASLDALFEDIAALAPRCRFRDCAHDDEPGCAVRDALAPDRLANYQKLQREIARDRADPLARQWARAKIKSRHRALRAMQKERGR